MSEIRTSNFDRRRIFGGWRRAVECNKSIISMIRARSTFNSFTFPVDAAGNARRMDASRAPVPQIRFNNALIIYYKPDYIHIP